MTHDQKGVGSWTNYHLFGVCTFLLTVPHSAFFGRKLTASVVACGSGKRQKPCDSPFLWIRFVMRGGREWNVKARQDPDGSSLVIVCLDGALNAASPTQHPSVPTWVSVNVPETADIIAVRRVNYVSADTIKTSHTLHPSVLHLWATCVVRMNEIPTV